MTVKEFCQYCRGKGFHGDEFTGGESYCLCPIGAALKKKEDERAFGVSVLIERDGLYLGVPRRDNPNDFGLPGGKVDETDKTNAEAAARECFEETGLVITNLKEIYRGDCGGDVAATFVGDWTGEPKAQPGEPECKWVTAEILMKGCFGAYNTEMFKVIL